MHKNSRDGHEVPYSPKLQDNLYEDTHPVPVQYVNKTMAGKNSSKDYLEGRDKSMQFQVPNWNS